MKEKTNNPFVTFYGEHAISPVRQDISDFKKHLMRRGNLYRTLGLPTGLFRERKILEVGPGGGYNALALFTWGANVDFVEPNLTAQHELQEQLNRYNVTNERWSLFPGLIEDFDSAKSYDVILAEGFIPGLYERSQVIEKLKSLVRPGGVVVVTCFDDLSIFFENLKRIIAFRLIGDIPVFQNKVKILAQAFESHLKALGYSSRPIEDYVMDNLLNPAMYGKMFSISDSIEEFGAGFEFLGSSPDMFTNYQWYKNVDFNINDHVLKQFKAKRHALLLWDLPESIRSDEENNELVRLAFNIRSLGRELEQDGLGKFKQINNMLIPLLEQFISKSNGIDVRIGKIITEVIRLIRDEYLTPEKVSNVEHFKRAFGRGQQYVSLQRKIDY